jgi:hypothetical protein
VGSETVFEYLCFVFLKLLKLLFGRVWLRTLYNVQEIPSHQHLICHNLFSSLYKLIDCAFWQWKSFQNLNCISRDFCCYFEMNCFIPKWLVLTKSNDLASVLYAVFYELWELTWEEFGGERQRWNANAITIQFFSTPQYTTVHYKRYVTFRR